MRTKRLYIHLRMFISVAMLVAAALPTVAGTHGAGIVASIKKAPVIADGDVSGMPTDVVITLNGSMNPWVPGRSLAAGDQIKVIFPPEFDLANLNPAYPLLDAPTPLPPLPNLMDNECVPAWLTCSTAVILQGWPQNPYFPPAIFHKMSIDPVENALIFIAAKDMLPNPPTEPGIKELHLILNGLTNPKPGYYHIRVEAQTGPGGSWETGSGFLRVRARTRPSINVTSVFVKAMTGQLGDAACGPGTNPPNLDNPVYQTTSVGAHASFPWTFLLWGRNNEPLTDVRLRWVSRRHALLRRGHRTIGHVYIDAPRRARGYRIRMHPLACPTMLGGAPVIAGTPGIGPQPVGRLDLQFKAGNKPGKYTTTIRMNNGNSVQMVVVAE